MLYFYLHTFIALRLELIVVGHKFEYTGFSGPCVTILMGSLLLVTFKTDRYQMVGYILLPDPYHIEPIWNKCKLNTNNTLPLPSGTVSTIVKSCCKIL